MSGLRTTKITLFAGILLALPAFTASAQDNRDSAAAAAEQDAKDIMNRASHPPDLSKDTPPAGIQQNGNAGTANISRQTNEHSETVTRGSEHSSGFSVGVGNGNRRDDDRRDDGHRDDPVGGNHDDSRPVAGEIANNPPPPPGWPGHDGANRPVNNQAGAVENFDAGPIWNNNDAQGKCPNVCGRNQRTWTGDWRTVGFNKSVCACAAGSDTQSPTAQSSGWGRGSSCQAPANHQCRGCSVSCPAGKEAHCSQGDRGIFTSPENAICPREAVCECR